MVLYFSGTGNSEYVVKRIADATDDLCVSLNEKIKASDFTCDITDDKIVFVTPTYAWRIPRVVSDWIIKTDFTGGKRVWFAMTCGGEIGNADKYLRKLCAKKDFEYMGVFEILMPENYIALFDAPEELEARYIVQKAEPKINAAVAKIAGGTVQKAKNVSITDVVKSSIVNDFFFAAIVKSKKFFTTQNCIGCGKCVTLCPMNNITLTDGKPVWGKNCTHCMACICRCPKNAIEYGSASVGKPRYTCPKPE